MNALKKNGGFTLVELIVVIAILAILAGVAVPAYSGYISKAQAAGDSTELSAVYTAVTAAFATKGEVTKIVVTCPTTSDSNGKIEVTYIPSGKTSSDVQTVSDILTEATLTGVKDDFVAFYGSKAPALKTGDTATWEKGEWKITTTASSSSSNSVE